MSPPSATVSTPTPTETAQQLTAATVVAAGEFVDFASTGPGRLVVVWRYCQNGNDQCRMAWELRTEQSDASGILRKKLVGYVEASPITPAGRDYVIRGAVINGQPGVILHADGTITRLHTGPSQPFRPRDVPVWSLPLDWASFADPRAAIVWPVARPAMDLNVAHTELSSRVDNNGTPWLFTRGPVPGFDQVVWKNSSGWHVHPLEHPITGEGGWIGGAVWSRPDGATQVFAVGRAVDWTTDSGASWHTSPADVFPFHPQTVKSVAADSSGTLYVVDRLGHLWRSTDTSWTHFTRMMRDSTVMEVQQAGDSVLAQVSSTAVRLQVVWLTGSSHSSPITIE